MQIASAKGLRKKIEWLFLILGVLFCLAQLVLSWHEPILDQYAFRQTQTAISVYWIMRGGAWLAYPTPVLGAPWAIPFEFPVYQWIVAIVAEHLRFLTLDQAGRVVSEFFLFACAWPLWRITSYYSGGRSLFRISATLLLFSPIYAFWSRSFMMESAVLFLSLWFVAALADFNARATIFGFSEMTFAGAMAACVKITTFVGFAFAGALIVLWAIYNERKNILRPILMIRYAAIAASVALSILTLFIWVHYSDSLKSENIFGRMLTADALRTWNFGTLMQRESWNIWHVIFKRAPDESMGSWKLPAVLSIYAICRLRRAQLLIYISLVILYFAPFMVFTNLHIVHHYYQYANSIFLVFAAGFAVWQINTNYPRLGVLLLTCVILVEVYGYSRYFYDDMTQPNRELQTLLASYVRSHVDENQMIVGFGLTWSSEVPYYAERRALLIPDFATPDMLNAVATNLSKYTGGMSVGAVIVCPNKFSEDKSNRSPYKKLLTTLVGNSTPNIVGYCEIFRPSDGTA